MGGIPEDGGPLDVLPWRRAGDDWDETSQAGSEDGEACAEGDLGAFLARNYPENHAFSFRELQDAGWVGAVMQWPMPTPWLSF